MTGKTEEKKPKQSKVSKDRKIKEVTNSFMLFILDNRLAINPYFALVEWAEKVLDKGCCPCRSERPTCPCDEALDEIKEEGKCACYWFLSQDQFYKFLEKASKPKEKA